MLAFDGGGPAAQGDCVLLTADVTDKRGHFGRVLPEV
jgi:hypothetical protein